MAARLLPKPFLMHIPSVAVPEAALSETGKLRAAAQQPSMTICCCEGLQSSALPEYGRLKLLKYNSRSGEKMWHGEG